MTSETKIDLSSPAQFHMEYYATQYRLDRNASSVEILSHIKEHMPLTFLMSDSSLEGFFVEIRLTKKKWCLCCCYDQ